MHRAARHVTYCLGIDIVFKENTRLLTNTQDSVASHHFRKYVMLNLLNLWHNECQCNRISDLYRGYRECALLLKCTILLLASLCVQLINTTSLSLEPYYLLNIPHCLLCSVTMKI